MKAKPNKALKRIARIHSQLANFKRFRLREELKLRVLKTIYEFKSKEEPKLEIDDVDVIHALSAIIQKRTE